MARLQAPKSHNLQRPIHCLAARAYLVNACYASLGDRLSVKIRPFSSAYTHSGIVEHVSCCHE